MEKPSRRTEARMARRRASAIRSRVRRYTATSPRARWRSRGSVPQPAFMFFVTPSAARCSSPEPMDAKEGRAYLCSVPRRKCPSTALAWCPAGRRRWPTRAQFRPTRRPRSKRDCTTEASGFAATSADGKSANGGPRRVPGRLEGLLQLVREESRRRRSMLDPPLLDLVCMLLRAFTDSQLHAGPSSER